MGTAEGDQALQGAMVLRDALLEKGWEPGTVTYTEGENLPHSERAWSLQAKDILRDFSSHLGKK